LRLTPAFGGPHSKAAAFGIKGFIPVSLLDWPGKVCAIVFVGGCGFRCPACHNSRLVLEHHSMADVPLEDVLAALKARRGWIDGITVTGGEPTASAALPELLATLKTNGIRIKLDTNGSNPAMLQAVIQRRLVDAVSMDVKAPVAAEEYARVAGVSVNPRTIARSVTILKNSDLEITFRTTVVPGLVEEPELQRIRDFLGDVERFRVQPFRNQETLDPALADLTPFTPERFERMRRLFELPCPDATEAPCYAYAG